jgi:hypothetical protein
MGHHQSYSGSHWTLSSGDYSLRITLSATSAKGKQTTMNKYTYFAGHFDSRGGALVRYCMHCPMDEVHGFGRSHWMPPSGEYCSQ